MADIPSGLSSLTAAEKSGFVAESKGFILWLGGALAGLTAILYTAGYLVTRAHLSLLGLYGVVDFSNDYIVQEGAKFFLVVGYSFGRGVVLPLLSVIGGAAIAVLLTKRLLRHTRVAHWGNSFRARLPGFSAEGSLRTIAFMFLFFVFLWHADIVLVKFQLPLCITNLLYADAGIAKCAPSLQDKAMALKGALLQRDEARLNEVFEELVVSTVQAAILTYIIWRVVLPWRWRVWFVAPSLVAAVFYLASLPMDYGVLRRPINYPRVVLTLDEKTVSSIVGPFFLLSKTGNDFVVWDASIRKLLWIPTGSVKRAEVGGVYDLFASVSDRQPAPQGKK